MSSIPKPTFTKFVQDWNGRKDWAQNAGIPFQDFARVVHYDYQRMTNSQGFATKMSDDEAFNAMSALKSGQDPFKTPADTTPTVLSNPAAAVRNDIQGIVTGLFHAPQVIGHDVMEAAHGHFGGVASLIPGYTDLTSLFSSSGRQYLLEHPVSDLLDFGGAGKIADLGSQALRGIGADSAAATLDRIPSHPMAKSLKFTFNQAAVHSTTIASLKEFGMRTLGQFGQLTEQKDNIIRPSRAAMEAMSKFPVADYYTTYGKDALKFGKNPAAPPMSEYLAERINGMTPDEINLAVNFARYNEVSTVDPLTHDQSYKGYDPTKAVTPKDFLENPNITEATKTLYRSLSDNQLSLSTAQLFEEQNIKMVQHRTKDNEFGFISKEGSPYEAYNRKLDKLSAKQQKDSAALHTALGTVYESMQHLHNEQIQIPAALRVTPNETVTVATSLRRLADYYRTHTNDLFTGGRNRGSYLMAMDRLFSGEGPLIRLYNNVSSLRNVRDSGPIFKDLKSLHTSLLKLRIPHDEVYDFFNSTIDDVHNSVHRMSTTQLNLGQLSEASKKSIAAYNKSMKSYDLSWNKYTQGRYAALAQREAMFGVNKYLTEHFQAGEFREVKLRDGTMKPITPDIVQAAIEQARNRDWSAPEIQLLIDRKAWSDIEDDAWLTVSDMKAAGVSPLFITGVSTHEYTRGIRPSLGDTSTYYKQSATRQQKSLFSDTIYNPIFGIQKEAIGIYRAAYRKALIDDFFSALTVSFREMSTESESFFSSHGVSEAHLANSPMRIEEYARAHHYVEYNPSNPFGQSHGYTATAKTEDKLWIKDYHLNLLQRTVTEMDSQLNRAYDKVMQVYRIGVLYLSPRFAAHVGLGGGMMTELRLQHPILSPIRYGREAWRLASDPANLPMFISKGVSEQGSRGELAANPFRDALKSNPSRIHLFLAGRKLGQLYGEAFTKRTGLHPLEGYKNLLEHISNFQRSLALIEGEELARPEEITPEVLAEAKRWHTTPEKWIGAIAARKVLADMQVVSPMERSIIMRYGMPFWGWTRHIIRYMATYPADHPLRASIIQSISNEAVGGNSTLPDYLFRLLFLGQPSPNGNVTVLDTRQWNPFRDVANYMTWGGIVSQLNPFIGATLSSAFGINSATGSMDLFPQVTFDSFYGSETAAPSGGNIFVDIAKQISPQLDTLINAMKSTSNLRVQAAKNPGTLAYLIADSIGFPWIPHPLNVKDIQIKKSTDETSLASQAVQRALTENSMAPLAGYSGLLPFSGYEVNKGYIEQLLHQAEAFNKANKLNLPALDIVSLPYSSPYSPEYLLANPSGG